MLNVREADLPQGAGAAAAVLEVDLLERFGGNLLQALVGAAPLLGVEEAGGVLRGTTTVRCRMRSSSVEPMGAV